MSEPTLFGIYTAQFPFLDNNETKLRPVIVISQPQGRHNIVVIIPISSQIKREGPDIILQQWSSAGLIKPSVARLHRLTTMLQSDLIAELGELQSKDIKSLKDAIRTFLEL